ncbi:MAG: hypothetical protein LBT89_02830 [Planctomycetaceae bacterium]|jgi:hypothetical protein|nr:hypothetical protein [Planctomycetaceae bacterium]
MKNWKTLVLLTVTVTFLASDFAQAQQRWRQRTRKPAATQPQTVTSQQTSPASPAGGWSNWKKVDRQAQAIVQKMAQQMPGGNPTALKYRVNGNHYQFQCRVVSVGMAPGGPRQAPWNETYDVYVNSDGSVEMR